MRSWLVPQPGNQARFVGATDLFAQIKDAIYSSTLTCRAQSLIFFGQGLRRIGGDHVAWRRAASLWFHVGTPLFPNVE